MEIILPSIELNILYTIVFLCYIFFWFLLTSWKFFRHYWRLQYRSYILFVGQIFNNLYVTYSYCFDFPTTFFFIFYTNGHCTEKKDPAFNGIDKRFSFPKRFLCSLMVFVIWSMVQSLTQINQDDNRLNIYHQLLFDWDWRKGWRTLSPFDNRCFKEYSITINKVWRDNPKKIEGAVLLKL